MQQSILKRKEDEIEMAPKKKSRHIKSLKSASARFTANTPDTTQWLALLCELSLQFESETRLDDLLQRMLVQLLDALPGATRGALLLCDQNTDVLLLKAYVPPDKPAVNKILVRQAISTGKGFTWQRDEEDTTTDSMAGMYVPLIWQGKALGAICVDTPQSGVAFTEDDLHLLSAIAHCAATALANRQLQEELRQKTKLLDRVLSSFSPKVRGKILERARHGKLCPGGKKSEVTILYADIRGFTRMSVGMDAEDIVNILNAYFSRLVKTIFHHDGIIDKFIGDAILAVFGSPEPDAQQHSKAVLAAWDMQAAMQALNRERETRGQVTCDIGIGIHCGEVLHGFIGAEEQVEFTVIGDAVNRASRYCDEAGAGAVLISPEVYQRVWEMIEEERITIGSKHEGNLTAYRVRNIM